MVGKTNKTKDVFGIQRELPLNYVSREVDNLFNDSLDRNHHVVIFGSSKQGKTSLRKKNLPEEEYILVHCSNKWDIYHINVNILKQAGFEITISEKLNTNGKAKVNASIGFNLFAKVGTEVEGGMSKEVETKELELDPEDVNDVIKALESLSFSQYIVLEDFHYLKPETQIDFAIELKAFHENSKITFIIVGVWLEENRLIALNGDLAGRVKSVNADEWKIEELRKLIHDGEILLNVTFEPEAINKIISESLNNVYVVQEVCYRICKKNNVDETSDVNVNLDCTNVVEIIEEVIEQHSGRYNKFLSSFIDGFQATELEMYKWILYCVLDTDIASLEKGLRRSDINAKLNIHHPKKELLNPGNLTQALNSVASLQIKKSITPIILDYDTSNLRLNIVDKGFLMWLRNQNVEDLKKDLGF